MLDNQQEVYVLRNEENNRFLSSHTNENATSLLRCACIFYCRSDLDKKLLELRKNRTEWRYCAVKVIPIIMTLEINLNSERKKDSLNTIRSRRT